MSSSKATGPKAHRSWEMWGLKDSDTEKTTYEISSQANDPNPLLCGHKFNGFKLKKFSLDETG